MVTKHPKGCGFSPCTLSVFKGSCVPSSLRSCFGAKHQPVRNQSAKVPGFPFVRRRIIPAGFGLISSLWLVTGLFILQPAHSEDSLHDMDATGKPIQPAQADPAILHALGQVSAGKIQQTIETLVAFHNRNTLSSMETGLPDGQGINAAADWIVAELRRYSADCGGCLEVKRDTFTQEPEPPPHGRFPRPATVTNIYAVMRGSKPSRMLLVTGHYDSRNTGSMETRQAAPGANDDASGVAVSLECARVLSKLKLPATLVFAAVAGEEQGLNGSKHLAHLAHSEGWQLEGVLNNDIVGGNSTPGETLQDKSAVRIFSEGIPAAATPEEIKRIAALGGESDSPSRELARAVMEVGRSYLPQAQAPPAAGTGRNAGFQPVLIFRRDRYLRGGDHISFNDEGFAAVRFTEWREDFNHQHQDLRTEKGIEYGDSLKFVDFDYVANVARLNAATLATLAAAPAPPRDVRIVTTDLDNNTTLRWSVAPQDTARSFEIVWRQTSAPDWQRSMLIGIADGKSGDTVTFSQTLPISKDNVIFGIRAIDSAGHRGAAVTPLPER